MQSTIPRLLEESVRNALQASSALYGIEIRLQNENAEDISPCIIVKCHYTGVAYEIRHSGAYGSECELEITTQVEASPGTAETAEVIARAVNDAYNSAASTHFSAFSVIFSDPIGDERQTHETSREITSRHRLRCALA